MSDNLVICPICGKYVPTLSSGLIRLHIFEKLICPGTRQFADETLADMPPESPETPADILA